MSNFIPSLFNYTDGNGLICPAKVPPSQKRGSDNGILYTSQAILLGGFYTPWMASIEACIDNKGKIHRSPDDPSEDAPDDYYGAPSATYPYIIGAKGTGAGAGTNGNAGGNGGDGYIEVTEYYQ